MNPLPVQPAKIHCPPARRDTLTRPRLNSWLDRASAGRLGLIVAEAGFGKTTLLGDWARHTRRLTAWYRLESDDRDWLTFIRHLVASGRELNPAFAPDTYAMLLALGSGGGSQADLIASIAQEMGAFGAASEHGLTLLIDDYHLVDDCEETQPIVKALLERTGTGFSVVIASRSTPTLRLGRMRTGGGVLTLTGRDLRFDVGETSRLFREAYQQPLEDDLVSDLCERTEGWAALLTLVHTRLEEERHPRELIAQLDATHDDIYDFVAEEVVSSLPGQLTEFLMRVAVLTRVDPDLASAVLPGTAEAAAQQIREAERLGLLTRPDRQSAHRFHTLVQGFLVDRLRTQIGEDAVREIHRLVAERLPKSDWQSRAWHYLQAGDRSACASTVDAAVEQILAAGEFDQVRAYLGPDAGDPDRATAMLLRAKAELSRGDHEGALRWARAAVKGSAGGSLAGVSLLTLAAALAMCGVADEAQVVNEQALACDLSPSQRYLAEANLSLLRASQEGDLLAIARSLESAAVEQERAGLRRYAGVSRLNLAGVLLWVADASAALREGRRAEVLLGGRATHSVERVAATAIAAVATAQIGQLSDAERAMDSATDVVTPLIAAEINLELARLELEFGATERAAEALDRFDPSRHSRGHIGLYNLLSGDLKLRQGDVNASRAYVERLHTDRCADAAGKLRGQLLRARVALRAGDENAAEVAAEASRIAKLQGSGRGTYIAGLLGAMASGQALDPLIAQGRGGSEYCWSILAEELASALGTLGEASVGSLRREAASRPDRWRMPLRDAILRGGATVTAASVLAQLGTRADAAWLRGQAATHKALRPHALAITERLAETVLIDDLGAVRLSMGPDGSRRPLRRKVLALLCYLASRPRMAASREEAIEALWSDLSPEAAANSLHQAIYFMRRVFEPDFREGMSANYIHMDGDVVGLNPQLVDSTSLRCWRLLKELRGGAREALGPLLATYNGRYALTFAYDDWAEAYRENLHAAVLAAAEGEMVRARQERDYRRAIEVGHAILAVDPQADAIELELVRSYKASGHRAAASEQYAHYAAYIRQELAAEPPSFDDV